jgi:hypothetical protein
MNSKRFVFVLSVLFIALFVTGCQKAPISSTDNASLPVGVQPATLNGQTFVYITDPVRVEHNTFSIVMPKSWTENTYKSSLVYMAPGTIFNNTFSEKVSMMVGAFPENNTRSLKEITEDAINASKKSSPDLQIIEWDDNARLGQIDAIKVVFSTRIQNRTLILTQLRAMQGNRMYAFSIQCEQEKCEHSDIFNEMAESFQWKNP